VELALNMLSAFNTQGDAILSEARGSNAPYRVRNNTGSSIRIWSDTQWNEKVNDQNAMLLENGKSIDWRFEDWKTMREVCPYLCDTLIFEVPTILQHVSSAGTSRLGVQFVGKPWDDVRSIPVDRAGEHIFSLRPRTEQYVERISCDVTVEDNIKVVTLRSTYTVHNETLYPLEVLLVDDAGQPVVKAAQKIGQCSS
jgi:vacuolar protein sorting-associated protein 13A/C